VESIFLERGFTHVNILLIGTCPLPGAVDISLTDEYYFPSSEMEEKSSLKLEELKKNK
jgi:hypothetical protein